MPNRSAVDTILGYFYQFDHSIEQILLQKNGQDTVTIEDIEDIDVYSASETTAIQCKYYAKTEYNNSVISRPIRLMLSHYKDSKSENKSNVKYSLYGYFKAGHHKLKLPLNVLLVPHTNRCMSGGSGK
jgi:hypothetical protein